jgi:thiol-disulfide isomerase/thioredoxin
MRISKRCIKIFFCCLLIWGSSACSFDSGEPSGLLNKQAPPTRLTMLDGTYVSFDQYQGKYIVLVFWAQWCPHSRPVVQKLSRIAEHMKRSDVVFVAVSVDEFNDYDKLKERITSLKVDNLNHAFSGNDFYDEAYLAFHGDALPHLFVINPGGTIIAEGHDASVVDAIPGA